ncbi:trehalose-6-phosphate synthase, partial [Enterococcus faecium]
AAVLVNPYDRDDVANALHRALIMPKEERIARHSEMMAVLRHQDINAWQEAFIRDLKQVKTRCTQNDSTSASLGCSMP